MAIVTVLPISTSVTVTDVLGGGGGRFLRVGHPSPCLASKIDPICCRRRWLQRQAVWSAVAEATTPFLPSLLPSFSATFPAYLNLSNTWRRGLSVCLMISSWLPVAFVFFLNASPACLLAACLPPQPPTCTRPGWERKKEGRLKGRQQPGVTIEGVRWHFIPWPSVFRMSQIRLPHAVTDAPSSGK